MIVAPERLVPGISARHWMQTHLQRVERAHLVDGLDTRAVRCPAMSRLAVAAMVAAFDPQDDEAADDEGRAPPAPA